MSVVTSVLLTMSVVEDGFDPEEGPAPRLAELNAFLARHDKEPVEFLTPSMIGRKHPQTLTFGCGYNYFPEADFLAYLAALSWGAPENVVLVMQPEDGETVVWRPDRAQ